MALLRDGFGNTPLLFTLRTNLEMGEIEIDTGDYLAINRAVIESGLADMIDVELSRGDAIMESLVEFAHRADIRVIGSRHDMTATPDKAAIVDSLCKMQKLGADVAKFAVTPQSERDVLALLDATLTMREKHNDTPVITMSMGRMGVVSRICGSTFGSSVTFGTAGKASAPGQLPANLLSIFLKSLS